jgi:hypothetical protein
VEEVPLPEEPRLTFDEESALAGEDEEGLLLVLGVVEAVRLARRQDMEPDSELLELGHRGLETAFRAARGQGPFLGGQPHRVPHVDDEPALVDRCKA